MRYTFLLLVVLVLVVAACGGDSVLGAGGTTTTQAGPAETTSTTEADVVPTVTLPVTSTTQGGPVPTSPGGGTGVYDVAAGAQACLAGNDLACDLTYLFSEAGSAEETISADCAGRGNTIDFCAGYDPNTSTAYTYGDEPMLDANGDACDALYYFSPFGSEYETFGDNYGSL